MVTEDLSLGHYRYKAFISYSHSDGKWAKWLHRALESYRVPKNIGTAADISRLGDIFRDAAELGAASDLSTHIQRSLADAEFLIVICSAEAGRSQWVNREVGYFEALNREDRVLCVLVDGEPEDPTCLPLVMRDRGEHGPLLVDPRPHADGKRYAVLRIVAALLDINLGRLQDREARRRHGRLAAGLGTLAAVSAALIGLAIVAIDARNDAYTERAIAEQERAKAEQSVDFLVDVLRVSDPSESRGSSVTARELLDKASSKIPEAMASDADTGVTLMLTVASIYTNLGLYQSAIDTLDDALVHEQQANPGSLSAAQIMSDIGVANHHLGNYHDAIELHQNALAIRETLAPGSAEIAHSCDNIGAAYFFMGDFENARKYMERALTLREKLFSTVNVDIATSFNNIGSLASQLGDWQGSIDRLTQAHAAFSELMGETHQQTLIVLNNLALELRQRGLLDEARARYAQLLTQTTAILDPPHPDLANAYHNYGIYLIETQQFDEALGYLRDAEQQWEATLGATHWRTLSARQQQGHAHLRAGHYDKAEKILRATLKDQAVEHSEHYSTINTNWLLAQVLYATGHPHDGLALSEKAYVMAKTRWPKDVGRQSVYLAQVARGFDLIGKHEKAFGMYAEILPKLVERFESDKPIVQDVTNWMKHVGSKQ